MSEGARIDTRYKWGQHVPLTCRNHPDLRWRTKNIDFIGARTVFYFPEENNHKPECACPLADLIVVSEVQA